MTRANPSVVLSGDHNECPGCGQLFNSTHAFELHRTGDHTHNRRRCLTPAEMQLKGMVQKVGGWWVSRLRTPLVEAWPFD
jgi:hypothetical protein